MSQKLDFGTDDFNKEVRIFRALTEAETSQINGHRDTSHNNNKGKK